jgi:hypothetical protein
VDIKAAISQICCYLGPMAKRSWTVDRNGKPWKITVLSFAEAEEEDARLRREDFVLRDIEEVGPPLDERAPSNESPRCQESDTTEPEGPSGGARAGGGRTMGAGKPG